MHGRLFFALTLFAITPALAQQNAEPAQQQHLSSQDRDFLRFAVQDNHAEIESCLLAENRAGDYAVKAFTRLMVDDHVQIASRLAALMNAGNFEAPVGIGREGQETMSKLESLHGKDFDRQFMQHQIEDHQHDLQRFDEIQAQTQNARLRQFASETYPILQQHLALAKSVDTSMSEASRRAAR